MKWSAPYYGVQHLVEGLPPQRRYQATVVDYGSFAEAWIIRLPEMRTVYEETHAAVEEARAWIESKVSGL